jgi:divalent metal cation (Fe/Co/Zn/Cd) transporter
MRPSIFAIISSIIVSGAAFALVVFRLDPHSGPVAPIAFFFTLFLMLASVLTLLIFGLRLWLQRSELINRALSLSFREGLLLSGVAVIFSLLQAYRRLNWWSTLIVVIIALLIELTFFANLADESGKTTNSKKTRSPL